MTRKQTGSDELAAGAAGGLRPGISKGARGRDASSKAGTAKRLSVDLPADLKAWLREESTRRTNETGELVSISDIVRQALEDLRARKGGR